MGVGGMVGGGIFSVPGLAVSIDGHADETCPAVPASCEKQHWPFDDPAKAAGTEEEIMAEFRRVRDQIRARIEAFLAS